MSITVSPREAVPNISITKGRYSLESAAKSRFLPGWDRKLIKVRRDKDQAAEEKKVISEKEGSSL